MQKYGAVIVLVYFCIVADSLKLSSSSLAYVNHIRQRRQTDQQRCTLPHHPEHGQWKLLRGNAKPGDKVPGSSVIKFECESGFKLSTENSYLVCDDEGWNSMRIPECEALCPPLYPSTTYQLKCIDKRGRQTKCDQAAHGTYVEYSCARFYETPFGYKKTLLCSNGKWNQRPVCQPVCGKKIGPGAKPFITGSKPNEVLEYPWITTLYRKNNDTFQYNCGGSILSLTVVITAAHCVTNDYGDVHPKESYLVGSGKLYRKYHAPEDTQAQYLELSKIIVHKDYKADFRRFLADIAVLIVKGEFSLNEVTQPVCFNNLNTIHLHPGNVGEVSGWGRTEDDDLSEKLRTLKIPYKYETTCAEELPRDWANKFNVIDKICAGFVNQSTSVCEGDSGNGLVFINPEDNRYYLHGIVSLGPLEKGNCNTQQNSLYTKVAFYYEYLDRLLTIYAPELKDCKLPPHPRNGKWVIDQPGKQPGDAVSSSTILKIGCNEGFKLSSLFTDINCGSAHNLPMCQALCPAPIFPNGTNYRCLNEMGQTVDCSEAVDGTKLVYACPKGYIAPEGTSIWSCKNGSWGSIQPECAKTIKVCGKKLSSSTEGIEYPWNVFLYIKRERSNQKFEYICGAAIILPQVVLTSAVCTTDTFSNEVAKDKLMLAAGKTYVDYDDVRDDKAQFSKVSRVFVHKGYRGEQRRYAADIAILLTESPFTFNKYVQPICFNGVNDIQLNPGDLGVVPKYNPKEKQIFVEIPFKDPTVCEQEFPENFADKYNLFDKICAGLDSINNSICTGDSGKAYAVKNSEDDRYYIHGIVSISHTIQNSPETICHQNTLYTSVSFYYNFVDQALADFKKIGDIR